MKQIILLALVSSACIAVAVATEIGMPKQAEHKISLHDIMAVAVANVAAPLGRPAVIPSEISLPDNGKASGK